MHVDYVELQNGSWNWKKKLII